MPVTLQEILQQLDADEPNYTALAALGPEAAPHLASLVAGEDPGLASKAAYLASLIHTDESLEVLTSAASSGHEAVRVAAAAGLRNLAPSQATPLADRLLNDADPGVRKLALRACGRLGIESLGTKVKSLASGDSAKEIREVATQALQEIAAVRESAEKQGAAARKRTTPRRSKGKKK
jgi:HEAT repeat protein